MGFGFIFFVLGRKWERPKHIIFDKWRNLKEVIDCCRILLLKVCTRRLGFGLMRILKLKVMFSVIFSICEDVNFDMLQIKFTLPKLRSWLANRWHNILYRFGKDYFSCSSNTDLFKKTISAYAQSLRTNFKHVFRSAPSEFDSWRWWNHTMVAKEKLKCLRESS